MFGFLRPGCSGRHYSQYRQVYAALCAHQRSQYGQLSSLVNSYEANFLYHLAVDAGVCEPPSANTPTCCRFRSNRNNRWKLHLELADFCTAFAITLVAVKVEDDLRDGNGLLPKFISTFYRRKFELAESKLERFSPGLVGVIRHHINAHLTMESPGSPVALEEYVKPTAGAFTAVFKAFGTLCTENGGDRSWSEIGDCVGTAIIAADSAFDFERDRKKNEFNPLPSRKARLAAVDLARKALSKAGWLSNPHACGVSTSIVRSTFDRLGLFARQLTTPNKLALARRGDCDCLSGCCEIGGCCAQGFDIASCIGEGGSCCSQVGAGGGDCCQNAGDTGCFCPCDLCCIDCGDDRRTRKKKNGTGEESPPSEIRDSIGKVCETASSLDPFGFVNLNGLAHPAKSCQPIAKHSKVRVHKVDAFGVHVGPTI